VTRKQFGSRGGCRVAGNSQRQAWGEWRDDLTHLVPGVCHLVNPLEASGIFYGNVAEEVDNMAVEEGGTYLLGEVVSHVEEPC